MTLRSVTDLDHAPAHSIGAVLRIRDFRNLWLGLGLSSLGDWIGLLAITALANERAGDLRGVVGGSSYQLENFAIAGVLFLRVLPALVMGPIAGYVADRLDRRATLIAGDYLRAALFASMPIVGSLWWVFVATVLIEAVSLVWGPAKDATVPNLVPLHRLEAANQVSLATTYGSALPAALLFTLLTVTAKAVHWSFGWWPGGGSPIQLALFFNAASFLVSGLVISRLRTIPRGAAATGAEHEGSPWKAITDGWRYVTGTPLVRGLVVGIIGAFAAGGVVVGLARTFVADLGGGEPGYGLLFACVFGGLGLGMWRGPRLLQGLSRRRLFGVALTGAGLTLIPIAAMQHLEIVTALTVLLGFCSGVAWITGTTMLGLEVPDEWRGRTFAFVGSMIRLALSLVLAIGPLVAGLIGRHSLHVPHSGVTLVYNGAAWTFLVAGLVMTAVGVSSYRQMDDRKGISLLSDLRSAISTTSGVYSATGVFVAFEGGEGAGKSTQSGLLRTWLEERGHAVLLTHEPGDTEVGRKVRTIVLDPATGSLADRTEALLYAADKAEHVETVVTPALRRGAVVITDRYVDSTLAYQGAGRSIPVAELERIARWATGDLRPHLTVLLDLEPTAGLTRFEERDRIEGESLEFHERVRAGFLELARATPERYLVVDARLPTEAIAAQVRARMVPLLEAVTEEVADGVTEVSVWDQLVGQGHVVERLQRAVAGDMTHAWLFTGPPGSGRSNAALAFAAALQCEQGGCGTCHSCHNVAIGSHADVNVTRTEKLSIGVAEVRDLVRSSALAPAGRGWQVMVVEDADRLTEPAANALLKSIEEPTIRTVWLLCAPTVEDVLPTIRSRTRLIVLATPSVAEVTDFLVRTDGVTPADASYAARASQGHIGRARALARDEDTRRRRREVVATPTRLNTLGACITAAASLHDIAKEEAEAMTTVHDAREKADLDTVYGVVERGRRPREYSPALRDLEKSQKTRAKRRHLDVVDRGLMDLVSVYRDTISLQLGASTDLVNEELRSDLVGLAASSTPEDNLRRIEAIFTAREQMLEFNVPALLALESMMMALRLARV